MSGFFILRQRYHSFVFISLDPTKPLLTKLQNRNQDIYKAYQMIGSFAEKLKNHKDDTDNEFQH